jgi:hypothetical protein
MRKTWHFITNYKEQNKTKYLSTERTQKKNSLARAREQKKT